MRIVIHDPVGHPFPIQLSRELARRGHRVTHLFMEGFQAPHGPLAKTGDDPETLVVEGISLGRDFDKYSLLKRFGQEREYGRALANRVNSISPDVVVSFNLPLLSQIILQASCRENGWRYVSWVQDLLGIGTHKQLTRKFLIAGALIGHYFIRLEKRLLAQSDAVILITRDFVPIVAGWGVDAHKTHVIENWAPLEDLPCLPRDNSWARANNLVGKSCILYSGTLGLKHDPRLLLSLGRHFRTRDDVVIVVISEGLGAEWLKRQKASLALDNVIVLDFQPYAMLAEVLASADVLVAILAADAGVFSVPSKVSTYMCAMRPILLAAPPENLASRIVSTKVAGIVVGPDDDRGFVEAADALLGDARQRERYAGNARRHAEATFDIEGIAERFEQIFEAVVG